MENSSDAQQELEIRIAFLERHIQEQDQEIMRLNKRIDTLADRVQLYEKRFNDLFEGGSENRLNMSEKPPHY
ncbi:MAG: SlyX family protein [Verrucomicrobiota bacterium]